MIRDSLAALAILAALYVATLNLPALAALY